MEGEGSTLLLREGGVRHSSELSQPEGGGQTLELLHLSVSQREVRSQAILALPSTGRRVLRAQGKCAKEEAHVLVVEHGSTGSQEGIWAGH